VCDFIAKRPGHLSRDDFYRHFKEKATDGFDPDRDLDKIGVANQTTMLANESLAIGAKIREAFVEAYGEEHADAHFRSFGTICSATQERQDAVLEMMKDPPDIMVVIGGYNSSNTNHLAHMCRGYTRTFHIQDAACIDPGGGPYATSRSWIPDAPEVEEEGWLPEGPFDLGITAGASTPNNKIGEAIARVLESRGGGDPQVGDREGRTGRVARLASAVPQAVGRLGDSLAELLQESAKVSFSSGSRLSTRPSTKLACRGKTPSMVWRPLVVRCARTTLLSSPDRSRATRPWASRRSMT
jgi:hypothetical protein